MTAQYHDGEGVTPPSSILGRPLTPPPTDEKQARDVRYVLQQVAKHKSTRTDQTIHKVNKRVWAAVGPLLLRDYKLRFDYCPLIERLVLRMPKSLHEHFISILSGHVSEQLRLYSLASGSAADFAKGVADVRSGDISPLDPEYGTHSPDGSFQHQESPLPTVIFEVAHSQAGKKLRDLAEDYILGSDLEIRVMVGFDIEYSKSKRATFSVWRASMQSADGDDVWVVEPVVLDQIFRHDDGKPNLDQDAGVHLRLEDFADRTTCRQFTDIDKPIFISCSELYQDLEQVEARIAGSTKLVRNPQLKKRRRTKTPEEQLDGRDEDFFAQAEALISQRQELDDSSYKESSSESV